LRHGWRCTGDGGQHDGRVGQRFHHVTFIREWPRRNAGVNAKVEGLS
jgi:hypothetical protein